MENKDNIKPESIITTLWLKKRKPPKWGDEKIEQNSNKISDKEEE